MAITILNIATLDHNFIRLSSDLLPSIFDASLTPIVVVPKSAKESKNTKIEVINKKLP